MIKGHRGLATGLNSIASEGGIKRLRDLCGGGVECGKQNNLRCCWSPKGVSDNMSEGYKLGLEPQLRKNVICGRKLSC